jgi:AcrR family transcriptional regulator
LSKATSLRADAARNRERLIEVARERFSAGEETASLGDIARTAGVGIGTLYRHFPTREALVEAVYRLELDTLAATAEDLLSLHTAFDALRLWMVRYARFVVAKRAMQEALRIAWTSRTSPVPETRARIRATLARFISAGASDGTIRDDVEADDVTICLAGVVLTATAAPTDQDQLHRLLGLLADGLRPSR